MLLHNSVFNERNNRSLTGSDKVETGIKLETFGAVAQLVERLLCKQDVRSSSLLSSTILRACSSAG